MDTTPANILSFGLLYNLYHSPYEGISSLVPQESTTKRNTIAWLPYVRDQFTFHDGALLDAGLGNQRIRDGYEPNGNSPYAITPEQPQGSYFESATSHSQRLEGNAALYIPPKHWRGTHNLKVGIDLDHIGFDQTISRAPVSYLREDRTVLRQSIFPTVAPYGRNNVEVGAYAQDRWSPDSSLILEPGIRFDWDDIIRRPYLAPRFAAAWTPTRLHDSTKISAGVGLYYEHTQLEYLERALAGVRTDTYFGPDGTTPVSPPLSTTFSFSQSVLREARALNWSIGLQQKFSPSTILTANVVRKHVFNEFVYANLSNPAGLSGSYVLTNERKDEDSLEEVDVRHTFPHGYTLFGAYAHSSARTNAGIDYLPTISMFGAQQSGPLPWDVPNRILSWGWLPLELPYFRKNWDFVYTADWHTGFPYTSINANQQVIGPPGARRFPGYGNFSPGFEWRFHFRGSYFGLRGVVENITNSRDYRVVNNNVDSSQYGTFSEYLGRAITGRIRLINSK